MKGSQSQSNLFTSFSYNCVSIFWLWYHRHILFLTLTIWQAKFFNADFVPKFQPVPFLLLHQLILHILVWFQIFDTIYLWSSPLTKPIIFFCIFQNPYSFYWCLFHLSILVLFLLLYFFLFNLLYFFLTWNS